MTCNNCKKIGHTENQCRFQKHNSYFHAAQNQKRPPQRVHYTTETFLEEETSSKDLEKTESVENALIESVANPEDCNQSLLS